MTYKLIINLKKFILNLFKKTKWTLRILLINYKNVMKNYLMCKKTLHIYLKMLYNKYEGDILWKYKE